MYQIDFHKPLHIHFIGIGGISMSGLAEVLLEEGFKVSGSDSKESPLTDSLTRKGARIFYGQRASNITDDVELVVYTAAIHPDNPEYASAVEKGIPMLTRAQLLGQIMRNYDTPIAVSGTHGKTTTTSMISQILLEADADPTISGALIINADTLHYQDIIKDLSCKIITYGLEHEAQYQATDITYDKYGHASFTVLKDGRKAGSFYLKVPGSHNVSNALAAIALARLLQIPNDVIVKGLGSFTGTDRRFQYKGEVAGVTIVDDYAHHPTEIQATLNAAHNYPHKKLWCVFQPHTYTRTKALLPEFAQALKLADHVVLADIYAARETDNLGISSKDLQARIQELGTPCEYFPTFDEIENFLLNNCEAGDLLITMGAGDVVKIGEQLLGK